MGRNDPDCVVLDTRDLTWKDKTCQDARHFLCGFPCNTLDPAARCNYAFMSGRLPWDQAEAICVAEGGHLATVASNEDYERFKAVAPWDDPADVVEAFGASKAEKGEFLTAETMTKLMEAFCARRPCSRLSVKAPWLPTRSDPGEAVG